MRAAVFRVPVLCALSSTLLPLPSTPKPLVPCCQRRNPHPPHPVPLRAQSPPPPPPPTLFRVSPSYVTRVHCRLKHPNIVPLLGLVVEHSSGAPKCLATELVRGTTLLQHAEQRRRDKGGLDLGEIVDVAVDVLEALDYMQSLTPEVVVMRCVSLLPALALPSPSAPALLPCLPPRAPLVPCACVFLCSCTGWHAIVDDAELS